jgi:hypothetical protein
VARYGISVDITVVSGGEQLIQDQIRSSRELDFAAGIAVYSQSEEAAMEREIPGEERPIIKNATDARQGVTGTGLIYVLVGGIALALIAWAIVHLAVR